MKTATLILILSAAGDLASTEYGISRGLYEGNPLMEKREVRVVSKVGVTALQILLAKHLDDTGHDKLATVVRTVGISTNLAAAGWNVAATVSWGK